MKRLCFVLMVSILGSSALFSMESRGGVLVAQQEDQTREKISRARIHYEDLMEAAMDGRADVVRKALERGAHEWKGALIYGAYAGHNAVVKVALDYSSIKEPADRAFIMAALDDAAESRNTSLIETISKHDKFIASEDSILKLRAVRLIKQLKAAQEKVDRKKAEAAIREQEVIEYKKHRVTLPSEKDLDVLLVQELDAHPVKQLQDIFPVPTTPTRPAGSIFFSR